MDPRVQYVRTPDGINIAFAVYGAGGVPLVSIEPPHVSHLKHEWQMPWNTHFRKIERLSAHRRVIRFDPRGAGLSDRQVVDHSLAARVSDLAAVVDRLELDSFAIHAVRNAALVALSYAAANPGRVSHLVLEDAFARGLDFWDTPINRGLIALAEYVWDVFTECNARVAWGWDHARDTPMGLAGDAALRHAAHTRACINQGDFLSWATAELAVDLVGILENVDAPTLVARPEMALVRGHDEDASRRVAAGIPGARFIVHGGIESLCAAIDELIADAPAAATGRLHANSGLRIVLFTDLEGHSAMVSRLGDARGRDVLREHDRLTRAALASHGGQEVKTMGDGFMACFDSAQRALDCAVALQRTLSAPATLLAAEGLRVRVGLNAGEPIAEDDDLFGASVIAAARIAATAAPGRILVANVVRELASGKGFRFDDAGEHALRGLSEPIRLWDLRWTD
ncbi:MAG: hypothetical protein KC495_04110 [Dehalococcoidia bacterium]|nr:hypothetical protein [Dehalococcoidia bacterium]